MAMTYDERSEFERLKRADVEQGKRIADGVAEIERLQAELTQTRLDLANSDAIRSAFVNQTIDVAKDIARALNTVEAAFHAGFLARIEGGLSPDEAYRAWLQKLQEQS